MTASDLERQALEYRRELLARDLKGWRERRPFAERTRQLDAELREVDQMLARFDRQRFA